MARGPAGDMEDCGSKNDPSTRLALAQGKPLRLADTPSVLARGGPRGPVGLAAFATIARREWLLRMLALGAAGCRRAADRASTRDSTGDHCLLGGDHALSPHEDESAKFLLFLPLVIADTRGTLTAGSPSDGNIPPTTANGPITCVEG